MKGVLGRNDVDPHVVLMAQVSVYTSADPLTAFEGCLISAKYFEHVSKQLSKFHSIPSIYANIHTKNISERKTRTTMSKIIRMNISSAEDNKVLKHLRV